MDYTIVTAWYDVREKENHPNKDDTSNQFFCSMDWYFDSAKQFFNKPFPMVIFTEPRFKETILKARPEHLHPLTRFIYKDYDELAFYKHFDKFEENHHKNKIQNVTQEKFTALYKFVVNQKVNFVKETILMNPFSTEKFGWMDMRLHCVYDMSMEETNEVFTNIPNDKVKIMQMSYTGPGDIWGRHDWYSWTRGKVAAGFFAGSREPVLKFCELCQTELLHAIREEMAPSDEMIYSHVIANNHNLFDPYSGDYGFCLKNLLRARGALHLVRGFLQKSMELGQWYYVWRIAESLKNGFVSKEIELSGEEIFKVWYYNYLANLQMGEKKSYCMTLLEELCSVALERGDVADQIKRRLDEVVSKVRELGEEGGEEMVARFEGFR